MCACMYPRACSPHLAQVNFLERPSVPEVTSDLWKKATTNYKAFPVQQIKNMTGKVAASGHGCAGLPRDDGEEETSRKGGSKKSKRPADGGADKKSKKSKKHGKDELTAGDEKKKKRRDKE